MAAQTIKPDDEWVDEEGWVDDSPPIPLDQAPPEISMGRRMWNSLSEPLTDLPSRAAAVVAEPFLKYGESGTGFLNKASLYGGAMAQSLGDVGSQMTSPIDLTAGVLSGGASMAAKRGFLAAAGKLNIAARLSSALPVAHGAETIYNAEGLGGKALGALELAGGLAGVRGQKFNPAVAQNLDELIPSRPAQVLDEIPAVADEWVDEIPSQEVLPYNPALVPEEVIPPVQALETAPTEQLDQLELPRETPLETTLEAPTQVVDDIIPEQLETSLADTTIPQEVAPLLPEPVVASAIPPEIAPMLRKNPNVGKTVEEIQAKYRTTPERAQKLYDEANVAESVSSPVVKSGLEDYSAAAELRARKILTDATGAEIPEGMTNKQIIDEARIQQGIVNPRSIPTKPKVKVRFDKATNSLVPDINDPATLAVVEAARTKKPVPQNARISPKELVEIPERPKPTGDAAKDDSAISQWLSIPRAIQSGYDISFPLRQGIGLVHTKGWWKAWPDMIRSYGNEGAYKGVMDSIAERPNHRGVPQIRNGRPIIGKDGLPAMGPSFSEQAGLAMSDLSSLTKREENLGSKLAENIPGIRASNRAYTAFANKLRADTFDSLIRDAENAGLNPRQDMVLSKAIAEYVNTASGRGSLFESVEPAAKTLNNLFFSPRLIASRIKMFDPRVYTMGHPFVRKQYWKSMASIVGAYSTFTGVLNLATGKTATDDPQSSEFGRTSIGNTRFDPSGGFLPYITLFARLGKGGLGMLTGDENGRYANKFPFKNPVSDIGQFAANKVSPYLAQGIKFGQSNKNRPYEVGDQALRMFTPIMLQDLSELLKDDPSIAPFGLALGATGIGVNNYEAGEVPSRLLPESLDPLANNRDFTIPRNFRR